MLLRTESTAPEAQKRAGLFLKQVRSQREVQIIQVATSVLLRKGCRDFRVEDVTRACGVAKGTCYQHFRSQPDLIAAAVRRLDEALAARLLSPAPRLTEPHQALQWALGEAVDAQILTITQRTQQAEPSTALEGNAWPCCLGTLPCPYGGAARCSAVLERWMTKPRFPDRVRSSIHLALLLALVPSHYFRPNHRGKLSNPRTIRSIASQLFEQLFLPKKLRR